MRSDEETRPRCYVPPEWPDGVLPPGAPDWESTAAAFLFDCCPPDFRLYPVLRQHVVILASFAAVFTDAARDASREGLARARSSLAGHAPVVAIETAIDAWQHQEAALARTARQVALVSDALRGRVFVQKL